jgi:repressor LexA
MNKEEAKKLFGMNLKKLRLEKGMSQEELAKKLGYKGRSAINKIETGVNDMPRDMVVRCAEVLGVSPLDLFFYEYLPDSDVHIPTQKDLLIDALDVTIKNESVRNAVHAILEESKSLPISKLDQILSYIKFLKQEG